MFVKCKNDTDDKVYLVYEIRTAESQQLVFKDSVSTPQTVVNEHIQFLLYYKDDWAWMPACDFMPVDNEPITDEQVEKSIL